MNLYRLKNRTTEVIYSCDPEFLDNSVEHRVYIIDKIVYQLFQERFDKYIKAGQLFLYDAKESNKTLTAVEKIYNFLQQNKVNRSSRIFAIGGGITTDITAFAASTYMRGCHLQLVPTTFLAMIDSAIGGKTAVNFKGIKNNLGTFSPAEKVYVCSSFLKTLPQQEINNGWAEAIKISLVNENDLYEEILTSDGKITESIIAKCIDVKFQLCRLDPEDQKERRVLNLGHTFGHVIEYLTNFTAPHGIAVALGIRAAAGLSFKEGFIGKEAFDKIIDILELFDFPDKIKIAANKKNNVLIKSILINDKKSVYKNNKPEINIIIFQDFQKAVQKVHPLRDIIKALLEVLN